MLYGNGHRWHGACAVETGGDITRNSRQELGKGTKSCFLKRVSMTQPSPEAVEAVMRIVAGSARGGRTTGSQVGPIGAGCD